MINCMRDCKYAQCNAGCRHWQAEYLKLKGQLQADIIQSADHIQEILEEKAQLQSALTIANEKIEEYKDALAAKFNAEMCEALKPLREKIAIATEENIEWQEQIADLCIEIASANEKIKRLRELPEIIIRNIKVGAVTLSWIRHHIEQTLKE